jgi:hypothetical protein
MGDFNDLKNKKLKELENEIKAIECKKIDTQNMKKYIDWINNNKILTENLKSLYTFYTYKKKKLNKMEDYYDIEADKIFSFSLFITNIKNLSYLIGLVYNFAIIQKHFKDYKMRIYIDFHSVFGSVETFNVFNMFMDILKTLDPEYENKIQMVVFFLNPYFAINNESIYCNIVTDLNEVIRYYDNIFYNTNYEYISSPLLNEMITKNLTSETLGNPTINVNNEILNITYSKNENIEKKSSFSLLACHIAVNLRFLPLNENCEFHVRDLDSRLSLTDKNIIKKFNNPKYEYTPFYVFQFYKYYFPYLKWRIDVNPYLAGCFGGDNRKKCMISKVLIENENMKILKKELFFKHILFLSLNASNLNIGFLNDEFILADIFEKIKGEYSENILYLNLGAFANKHVNEFSYGINENNTYPCVLKLGTPIKILMYQLNGKYLTIDPITDFKLGNIDKKYYDILKKLIIINLQKYLDYPVNNYGGIAEFESIIRNNYNNRLNTKIEDDLEGALFFSMTPSYYSNTNVGEFNSNTYTINSYSSQTFSSIGTIGYFSQNEKLKSLNFMSAGYLLSDLLEDIIFPTNPSYVDSNSYITEQNYDRLFNCLYFDETNKTFLQKKINKKDLQRKYIDTNIIEKIPDNYIEFSNKNQVVQDLNVEFNEYLKTCQYFPSFFEYIQQIKFYKYIKINNNLIKTGILIFIKEYDSPILDVNDKSINNINNLAIHKIKFDIDDKNNINGVNISKSKLRFNLILLDDKYINQMKYHDINNKNRVLINTVKNIHLNNLSQLLQKYNYNDVVILNKL